VSRIFETDFEKKTLISKISIRLLKFLDWIARGQKENMPCTD